MHRFKSFAKLVAAPCVLLPFVGASALAQSHEKAPKGVYLWGDNSNGLISNVLNAPVTIRQPTKVDFLEGESIKSVAVSPRFALAVLKNGKVCQWSSPIDHQILPNLPKVSSVFITAKTGHAIALGENGKIYTWKADKPTEIISLKFAESTTALGWFEKIVDVKHGVDHIVALTNKGRVFSSFLSNSESVQHHGQLGLAAYPHFEALPEPLKLHQIKLVDGSIKQIACGNYHTLLLNDRNELWGCGSNQFCQLMLPFTYKNAKVSVPVKLNAPACSSIAAGSSVSMFYNKEGWFTCGNGEYGQFGTGSFSQCQSSPIRITALGNMREFNEKTNSIVPVEVTSDNLSIGSTHVFAGMNNPAGDYLLWGSNERGQLGNNRLSKIVKPTPVTSVSEIYQTLGRVKYVAGDRVSACFSYPF